MVPIFCALWFPKTVHYGSRFLCILICRRLCIVISRLQGFAYKRDTFKIIHDLQPYLDDNKIIEKAEARIAQNGKVVLYEIPEKYYSITTIWHEPPARPMPMVQTNVHTIFVIRCTTGEMIGIKKENFESEMLKLLSDALDILERIENKTLKYKHLERIVEEYNRRF